MPLNQEYKLNSIMIKDILEKVPTDRVETLMKELTSVILHSKMTMDIGTTLAGGEIGKAVLPNPLVWKDDGKGEVEVRHSINETPIMISREVVS